MRKILVTTEQTDLRSRLWEAANILRGSAVDRTDWKGYILPLLFYKRICDVWDEENVEATEIYGDTELSLELWTVISGISGFDD